MSFTAGADDLHAALSTSGLVTTLAGGQTIIWSGTGTSEIIGTENGVQVVKFDITAGSTIAAGTTGSVTVTETLLAPITGEGTGTPDLGTVNVVASDTVNPASVTDTVTANVVDDGPKANADATTATDGGPAVTALTGGRDEHYGERRVGRRHADQCDGDRGDEQRQSCRARSGRR